MKINLEKMSRAELEELQVQVEEALISLAQSEKDAALKAAEEAAKAHGYSLAELGIAPGQKGRRKSGAKAPKSPAKYRNPADPTQTWSGRGRRPQWIKEAEASGTDLASLAI